MDFARVELTIRGRVADIPLRVNEMGHYVLNVVAFGEGSSRIDRGPKLAAAYFEWALLDKRPDLSNGGLRFPFSEGGLFRFEPPRLFPACTAATLRGARVESAPDPGKVIMKLHVNWGHASARTLKRALADLDGG